ncbi:AAA family ATPase [Sorangium sp. So ce363]|uniref:AAA family ATPase n=1 Tax=Sorangium sp. So ce363 TaxID=3133304 RepID=UPI003F6322C9
MGSHLGRVDRRCAAGHAEQRRRRERARSGRRGCGTCEAAELSRRLSNSGRALDAPGAAGDSPPRALVASTPSRRAIAPARGESPCPSSQPAASPIFASSVARRRTGYVDKTPLIGQLLADPAQVVLFPRSRRFGKTLNISTLAYFLGERDERAVRLRRAPSLPQGDHPDRRVGHPHPVRLLERLYRRGDAVLPELLLCCFQGQPLS